MGKKAISLTEVAKMAGYVGGFDEELDTEVSAPGLDILAAVTNRDVENIWRRREGDKDDTALFV